MEAANRVATVAPGSETESDPGVDSDHENEVDYPPKGNALVRNPYTGRLEMRPHLEARYKVQKEAWEEEQRAKKAAKEAEDQAKNLSDANDDTNGKATESENATIHVETNAVREGDTSANNAEDETNVTPVTITTENGQLGVERHGVAENYVSSTDASKRVCTPGTSRVSTMVISGSSDDGDADKVPATDKLDPVGLFIYNNLIHEFGDRPSWAQIHRQYLACSALKRKLVIARLCHLACLRNLALPKVRERQGLLRGKPPLLLINHLAWVGFIARYPGLVDRVIKYVNWLEMLEAEYAQAVPHFEMFWTAAECGEAPGADVLEALVEMNRKRVFLQGKVFAEEQVVDELSDETENAPTWIEWVERRRRAAKK